MLRGSQSPSMEGKKLFCMHLHSIITSFSPHVTFPWSWVSPGLYLSLGCCYGSDLSASSPASVIPRDVFFFCAQSCVDITAWGCRVRAPQSVWQVWPEPKGPAWLQLVPDPAREARASLHAQALQTWSAISVTSRNIPNEPNLLLKL